MMKHLFFVVSLMALISCGENLSKTRGEIDKTALLAKGDSIAMIAQKTLVGKLTSAISERGVPGAVAFCKSECNAPYGQPFNVKQCWYPKAQR
ncbi:hypothetical protein MASR1M65_15950 [Saprospiraceae bacterium]